MRSPNAAPPTPEPPANPSTGGVTKIMSLCKSDCWATLTQTQIQSHPREELHMFSLCPQRARRAVVATFLCAITLTAHAALGPNEAVEYTYRGNNLDHHFTMSPGGSYEFDVDVDGIDFSFYMPDYIQAGQTINLRDNMGSFTGVMGTGDQFSTWKFAWYGGADFTSYNTSTLVEDRIRNWPHTTTYNEDKPGVWEMRLVTLGPQHPAYGVAAPVGQHTMVPEPSAWVLAALGLTLAAPLTRRKAKERRVRATV